MKPVGAAFGCTALAVVAGAGVLTARAQAPLQPGYTAKGELVFPADYRTWIYLSTGMNMAYTQAAMAPGAAVFDNVFVNPAAYQAFQQTGTWPDKTMLVLEVRSGAQKGSINKAGHFQTDAMGMEIHVKDEARFKGGWAFFGFQPGQAAAPMIPTSAACYSCHAAHAAVDTTFVQFYPTLLPLARAKDTLSKAYLADEAAAAK